MNEQIRQGLTARQKWLPAALLYDELGSALFEAITLLPEYQVARVDTALLQANIDDALLHLPGELELVELGPGHGRKASFVLEALSRRQPRSRFVAVDVSSAALDGCRRHLERLPGIEVSTLEATFIEGLRKVSERARHCRRLVLFLGSNLSNFDRRDSHQFLCDVRAALAPGDGLLLSADLEKPSERLLPAYDDALGVTAAFNRNVLLRLNREYGANFDVAGFTHEARWNPRHRRVEMHLRAAREQRVHISRLALEIHFDAGESVWTESSHRFTLDELRSWGFDAGLTLTKGWVDSDWPLALCLFTATEKPRSNP